MQGRRSSIASGLAAVLVLVVAQSALADRTWQLNGVALNPGANPADVVAATDKLLASPIGKQATGRVMLLANIADGDNPATHSYVILNKSAAEGEVYGQKLYADPAWAQFQSALANLSGGGATVRNRTIKSWGDISDSDVVWLGVFLAVRDEQAVLAARERYAASATGKKFPGQAHFSAVVAGGASPVTHTFSVGYASEAEMESWTASRAGADWQAYQRDLRANAEILGFTLSRVVKSWGPATMKDVSAP
jgi:hypothetical protein